MKKLYLLCMFLSFASQAVEMPNPGSLRKMYKDGIPVACYSFIQEDGITDKCMTKSMEIMAKMDITPQKFSKAQLLLVATRSQMNSARMNNAKHILKALTGMK